MILDRNKAILKTALTGTVCAVLCVIPSGAQTPDPTAATLNTVETKLLRYDTNGARTDLQRVFDDKNARHQRAMGAVAEQEKRYAAAATHYRKATQLADSDPAAFVSLGQTLLRNGGATPAERSEATAAFEQARVLATKRLAAEPNHFLSAYYLGLAHRGKGQHSLAIDKLQQARKMRATNPLVAFELGVTYGYAEQWQSAFDTLTAAIDANPGIAYAYYYRGLSAEKLGRKDLLITDLDRFVSLAPDAPEAAQAKRILAAARR